MASSMPISAIISVDRRGCPVSTLTVKLPSRAARCERLRMRSEACIFSSAAIWSLMLRDRPTHFIGLPSTGLRMTPAIDSIQT